MSLPKQLPPAPLLTNEPHLLMRSSAVTPRRSVAMSTLGMASPMRAPTPFQNEMYVSSSVLATYLMDSDVSGVVSMYRMRTWLTNCEYTLRMMAKSSGVSAPTTTRSGLRDSSTALPSGRNSGLDTTPTFVAPALA